MTSATSVIISQAVLRRLTLSLLRWRWDGAVWVRNGEVLTEEQVDVMPAQTWKAIVQLWVAGAARN